MLLEYRILLLGDFYFGETYSRGRVIERIGYQNSLEGLYPFVECADYTVASFSAPIRGFNDLSDDVSSKRRTPHSADVKYTGKALRSLGVDAVNLANAHTMDHGHRGIASTFQALEDSGIRWFGAGHNVSQAFAQHVIPIPNKFGTGDFRLAGMCQHRERDRPERVFAAEDSPGLAPLDPGGVEELKIGDPVRDFAVAFPHWGKRYSPVTNDQLVMARSLSSVGYRAIVGHGSHTLQSAAFVDEVPTFFGIGNGMFNSPGRYSKAAQDKACFPYSLWMMLTVSRSKQHRDVEVKLYPVYSDNLVTDYCPAPLGEKDFDDVLEFFDRTPVYGSPMRFEAGKDDLGFHLASDVGDWKIEHSAVAEKAVVTETVEVRFEAEQSPNTYSDDRSAGMLKQAQRRGGSSGTIILADAAIRDGAEIDWVSESVAIAKLGGDKWILSAHRGTESPVGATIVKDKLLAKRFFQERGVSTPRGRLVSSAEEAVEFMREINRPIVLKPRFGSTGKGVSVNLTDPNIIRGAFKKAAVHGDVLVEETIHKVSEYRCLASTTKCYSVTERLLPSVVGDGTSSIEDLIKQKNSERQNNLSTRNRPIPLDDAVGRALSKQGYAIESVLERGKSLTVRDVGGLSSGGEPFERTASVDESVKTLAIAATQAIPGLNWAGADIIITPDGLPYVIEINTNADISGANFPLYGVPVPMGDILWQKIKTRPPTTSPTLNNEMRNLLDQSGDLSKRALPTRRERLGSLFVDALNSAGISVQEVSKTIRKVSFPGEELWFRNVSSASDRASSTALLARHRQVRDFLTFHGFQLPQAYYRVSGRRFREIVPQLEGEWACVRGRRAWPGRDQGIAISAEELRIEDLRLKSPSVLQHIPEGVLFRALASSERCLFVCSPHQETGQPIARVEELALEVARCIPDVSLVGIDLVLPREGKADDQMLIEGLSVNPVIDPTWMVVSGSLDNAWEWLLGRPFP